MSSSKITPLSGPLFSLLLLAQWPLCAALARPLGQGVLTATNGLCVLLILAGPGLWILGCRTGGIGRVTAIFLGSFLLAGSLFLSLRSQAAYWPLFLCAAAWFLTFVQFLKVRARRS